MSESPQNIFTAAQIAQGLGMSRQAVHKALQEAPARQAMLDGVMANFWTVDQLPAHYLAKLQEKARACGWRSVPDMLAGKETRWEPSAPLGECAEEELEKARKLREAMANALAQRNTVSSMALAEIGLADYRRVFGHEIKARNWTFLFERTVERAGAASDFNRLEIYLAGNPKLKRAAEAVPPAAEYQWPELSAALSLCRDQANLTAGEADNIWLVALEEFKARVDDGEAARTVKGQLFDFLMAHVPNLAASRDALRVAMDRRFARWTQEGCKATALRDRRAAANAKRSKPILQADVDMLVSYAAFKTDGRISQAVRECLEGRLVSESLLGRIVHNPTSKSYVPTWLRDRIKHEVAMMNELHHGERKARDNGAYLDRCWDAVPALEWWCGDDCTLPVYFYVPDGKGWFTLMRGQFLLMIDARTTACLGYCLIPERGYTARAIRTMITKCADVYGLPYKGFYFERGIWKDSKILTGDRNAEAMEWGEAELGLKEFGLRFIHAQRARSKPVERTLGALQSLMEGEPGYAGRDEIHAGFEKFKKLKLAVDAKRIDPRGQFYTMEAWDARLGELCDKYNATVQHGKHTCGLSPAEALRKFRPSAPPVQFDARCRHLLAHHKRPVTVTANGITLRFSNQVYTYRNAKTGELRGRQVLAWFNPETPEILAVTDLERRNAFCVERAQEVPAMDAPQDILDQEMERIGAHQEFAKTRFRVLKPAFEMQFRPNLVDLRTVRVGKQIEAGKAEIESRKQDNQVTQRKAARLEKQLLEKVGDSKGARALVEMSKRGGAEGLEMMLEALSEGEKEDKKQ